MLLLSPRRLSCALVWALLLIVPAEAIASPPSAAEFERATQRLLDGPAFSAAGPASRGPGTKALDDPVFPRNLFVTLYGAPQLVNTELGTRSPKSAVREVAKLSSKYERKSGGGVVPGFDLIGVVANSTPGPDRKYRTRQPDEIIGTYLKRVREIGGRLMLDIQPGRSTALGEVKALEDWIAEPDVDVGIDPEWNVGPDGIPGQTTGAITAAEINAASRRMDQIVEREGLPPKVLIVHQFTKKMIENRRAIRQRDGVQVVLNFDGIGSPAAKDAGYAALATRGLFNGFSIFLRLDTNVMRPGAILDLAPAVNFLLYQ